MNLTEHEIKIIKFALEQLHDSDLSGLGDDNIKALEKLMDKMNIKYSSQL